MAEIFSLPASTSLLAEINAVGAPNRLKAQDGTIGDRAHMKRPSDHNLDEIGNTGSSSDSDSTPEVHARDADARGPWLPGWSMARIVAIILGRCRAGVEKRLKYIIFDCWIYEASNDWTKRKHTGADQHREHAHFSFRYGSGSGASNPENITAPWGLIAAMEAEDDVSKQDVVDGLKEFFAVSKQPSGQPESKIGHDASAQGVPDTINGGTTALYKLIGAIGTQLLLARKDIASITGRDMVDEGQVAAAVLAGLTTERLSAAITAAGLTPQALADAVPDDMAERVADVLGRRISGTA